LAVQPTDSTIQSVSSIKVNFETEVDGAGDHQMMIVKNGTRIYETIAPWRLCVNPKKPQLHNKETKAGLQNDATFYLLRKPSPRGGRQF
jgi:hypothetical protein